MVLPDEPASCPFPASLREKGLLVLVPHGGRLGLLPPCLEACRPWPTLVLDDSEATIPKGFLSPYAPWVAHFRTGPSSGFARVVNRGLHLAETWGFSLAVLLNDEARPREHCVFRLREALGRDPRVAIAGPVLVDEAGIVQSAGFRFSPRTGRLRARSRLPRREVSVDAVSGACLAMETRHRLDERFPFYFEDIELCLRLRRRGERVHLVPAARCVHLGGASVSPRTRRSTRLALQGHLRLVGPGPLRRWHVLALAAAQVLREGPRRERLAGLWEGWRAESGAFPPRGPRSAG